MRGHGEGIARLVEADVPVVPQAQKLQIDAAGLRDCLLVSVARRLGIIHRAVGYMCLLDVDIDVVEEVVLHEVTVALVVSSRQAAIFVEIERLRIREADLARVARAHELGIQANRGRARREAEDAVRLRLQLLRDHVRRGNAHLLIVFGNHYVHVSFPFQPAASPAAPSLSSSATRMLRRTRYVQNSTVSKKLEYAHEYTSEYHPVSGTKQMSAL